MKEWLVSYPRENARQIPKDWPRNVSEVPGIVVRSPDPRTYVAYPRVSLEVLGSDLAVARLQERMGPVFSISPLSPVAAQDW